MSNSAVWKPETQKGILFGVDVNEKRFLESMSMSPVIESGYYSYKVTTRHALNPNIYIRVRSFSVTS